VTNASWCSFASASRWCTRSYYILPFGKSTFFGLPSRCPRQTPRDSVWSTLQDRSLIDHCGNLAPHAASGWLTHRNFSASAVGNERFRGTWVSYTHRKISPRPPTRNNAASLAFQLSHAGRHQSSKRTPPHGSYSPHRTLSGHVVCLFVFVCVCVCTLE
jgi:hypothetical protein